MITRTYFISAQKPHNDNNGSYSFRHGVVTHKSWFTNGEEALDYAVEEVLKSFQADGLKGDDLDVTAFNRI